LRLLSPSRTASILGFARYFANKITSVATSVNSVSSVGKILKTNHRAHRVRAPADTYTRIACECCCHTRSYARAYSRAEIRHEKSLLMPLRMSFCHEP